MILDRAIDLVAEATRDLTVIVLQHHPDPPVLTDTQVRRLRQIADQLRVLAGP